MRVLLKFPIECDADAAWRALHSPAALAELYGPLLTLQPLTDPPTSWQSGQDAAVRLAGGGIPFGTQLISVTDRTVAGSDGPVRILRDAGAPLTGPLAALEVWDHQMAVSPLPDGRTLWRERLVIGGPAAPVLWPALWATWQWRARRIRALAPSWAHEPATAP